MKKRLSRAQLIGKLGALSRGVKKLERALVDRYAREHCFSCGRHGYALGVGGVSFSHQRGRCDLCVSAQRAWNMGHWADVVKKAAELEEANRKRHFRVVQR